MRKFRCASCGQQANVGKGKVFCTCGAIYDDKHKRINAVTLIEQVTECCYRGKVLGSIPAKKCGCGMAADSLVYECVLHDSETTLRRIPNHQYRRDRNCMDCIADGENI